MYEKENLILEIEANSLKEARQLLQAKIPKGADLLHEEILEQPIQTDIQDFTVEADTLQETKKIAREKIPEGFLLLSEEIWSTGQPTTLTRERDSTELAFIAARQDVPADAKILEEKVLTVEEHKTITIQVFDENSALEKAKSEVLKINPQAKLLQMKLSKPGKQGFIGLGKKPNEYEVELLANPAKVQVIYQEKARVNITVGIQKAKARIALTVGRMPQKVDKWTIFDYIILASLYPYAMERILYICKTGKYEFVKGIYDVADEYVYDHKNDDEWGSRIDPAEKRIYQTCKSICDYCYENRREFSIWII